MALPIGPRASAAAAAWRAGVPSHTWHGHTHLLNIILPVVALTVVKSLTRIETKNSKDRQEIYKEIENGKESK
jgi:hypothetical protein